MVIQEPIGRRSRIKGTIAAGICVLVIAAAGGLLLWQSGVTHIGDQGLELPKLWYTTDDGKTFFADDADRISPFDHNGKPAYRCYVWTCDGGKTRFVSHLERLKPPLWQKHRTEGRVRPQDLTISSFDVKPPLAGEGAWVDFSSPVGERIRTPKCPSGAAGGGNAVPQAVEAK